MHEIVPGLVGQVAPKLKLVRIRGVVRDTLLWQDAHVDLKAEQCKHGQGKDSKNDHISEVFDGVHDGTDDGF